MMETVSLYRLSSGDQGTRDVVAGPRGFFCAAIELPWRENRANRSCIPAGDYVCKPHRSKKFGSVYHVTGVDRRTWILTHAGNLAGDRELGYKTHSYGCILFGKEFGKLLIGGRHQEAVLVSKPTIRRFVEHMGRQPFRLRIVEVVNISGGYRKAA